MELSNEPAGQLSMTQRVVVVGAESTGTTTLTIALADFYQQRGGVFSATQWVREFGRDMSFIKLERLRSQDPTASMDDLIWTDEDFVAIAREQNRLEDEAAALSGPLLLCDTDAWATVIWQERYMSHRTPAVEALAQHHPRALYILTTDEGVAFEADEVRDGEHLREAMTTRFRECLATQSVPFIELNGRDFNQRVQLAVAAIDEQLGL